MKATNLILGAAVIGLMSAGTLVQAKEHKKASGGKFKCELSGCKGESGCHQTVMTKNEAECKAKQKEMDGKKGGEHHEDSAEG